MGANLLLLGLAITGSLLFCQFPRMESAHFDTKKTTNLVFIRVFNNNFLIVSCEGGPWNTLDYVILGMQYITNTRK